jgi:SAM-dependent methyltransferase
MQKNIFLNDEGDAWFERNHKAIQNRSFDDDPVVQAIARVLPSIPSGERLQLLEVGCGEGKRLAWLAANLGLECFGIEPSAKAVAAAKAMGIQALQGTADELPYKAGTFDIVVFGFCLYLCDRQDLFRIAQEADRVLKPEAWLVIHDFFASAPTRREYHHKSGIYSYKMDYRKLFDWHPAYTCFAHEVNHHGRHQVTDDFQEWVATSLLRKKNIE